MAKFALTMSAQSGGEIIHNSYSFESNRAVSEQELVQSYQEFYPSYSHIRVVSFTKIEKEMTAELV